MAATSPHTAISESQTGSSFVNAATPFFEYVSREDYLMLPAEQGSYQALRLMASAVRGECSPDYSGYSDPKNKSASIEIIGGLSRWPADNRGLIDALFRFVRDRIEYLDHPMGNQVVQDCQRTLQIGSADCVSKSVCLATLLASLEIPSRFVAQHPSADDAFSHVYVETLDGIALDSIADGRAGRPLFQIGNRQRLPNTQDSFELNWDIF